MDRLHVRDDDFTWPEAAGAPALLQHGCARNGDMWRGWVPHLGRSRRVLRPDLPGCGASPDPGRDYAFTQERLVPRYVELLDSLSIERVHWIGEGLGAVLGAMLAGDHPDRLASLTLITMPLRVDEDIQRSHALGYPTWIDAIEALGTRRWWNGARAAANDLTGDPAIDDHIAEEVSRTPTHVTAALSRWATSWTFTDLLPRVTARTLLIWAEGSTFVDQAQRDEITALAPDGRQHVVRGIDTQMFPFTRPELVAPTVADFVTASDRARPSRAPGSAA